MNLSIYEWEQIQDYAHVCADELKHKYNLDVRVKPYTMYDGRRGVYLQLFDKYGVYFTEYASGIYKTVNEYIKAIERNYFLIINKHVK